MLFHIIGTAMEIFKTYIGSWEYPETNIIRIGGVPLFSGFMYSAIGSYIARVWRIFHFRFEHYPPRIWTIFLCFFIYLNFFTHHYIWDIRYILFAVIGLIFFKTRIYFTPHTKEYFMPLLLGWGLVALFIWIAENLGTFCTIWVYPSQHSAWHVVPLTKMGSWYLLMMISFVFVTLANPEKNHIDE